MKNVLIFLGGAATLYVGYMAWCKMKKKKALKDAVAKNQKEVVVQDPNQFGYDMRMFPLESNARVGYNFEEWATVSPAKTLIIQ